MDKQMEELCNNLIEYIDEYNNGKKEYIYIIKEIIKGMKGLTRTSKWYYLFYYLTTKFNVLTAKIYNSPVLQSESYHKLINECYMLAETYKQYMQILKEYLLEIKKTKDYSDLSIAYEFSIKSTEIFDIINELFTTINSVDRVAAKFFDLYYSDDYLAEKEKGILEIEALANQITRNKK